MTQPHLIYCSKLQKKAAGLINPPLPGELGKKIYEQISQEAWNMWLAHQTMLINEYRLSMIEAKSRAFLLTEMKNFLFGTGSKKPPGFIEE